MVVLPAEVLSAAMLSAAVWLAEVLEAAVLSVAVLLAESGLLHLVVLSGTNFELYTPADLLEAPLVLSVCVGSAETTQMAVAADGIVAAAPRTPEHRLEREVQIL